MLEKDNAIRRKHCDFINGVINKYGRLYTSAKTIPTQVYSEHKNQVETFSRQFMKVTDTATKLDYLSEDDKKKYSTAFDT